MDEDGELFPVLFVLALIAAMVVVSFVKIDETILLSEDIQLVFAQDCAELGESSEYQSGAISESNDEICLLLTIDGSFIELSSQEVEMKLE